MFIGNFSTERDRVRKQKITSESKLNEKILEIVGLSIRIAFRVDVGARAGNSKGLASISGRQGRRPGRHGANGGEGGQGSKYRPRYPGLSGRLAFQAERPVERHGQRAARHNALSA